MTAPRSDLAALRAKAVDQLDRVEHELTIAMLNRQLYVAIRDEIVARRPHSDGTFLNSYSNVYGRAQLMAVRRLADTAHGTDSLWWLLERIKANPAIASRAAVVEEVRRRADDWMAGYIDSEFEVRYRGTDIPSAELLCQLQARLRDDLEHVITYVDRVVAHRDPRGPNHNVAFAEVHGALDRVAAVANEVSLMLRSSSTDYSLIAIQGDWQECLRPGLFPLDPSIYQWADPRGFS